jgi:hypothetical protein
MCYHCANAILMLEYCVVNAPTNEPVPHRSVRGRGDTGLDELR